MDGGRFHLQDTKMCHSADEYNSEQHRVKTNVHKEDIKTKSGVHETADARIKTTPKKIRDVQTIERICQGNPDPKIPAKLFIGATEAKVIREPETATIVSEKEKMADTSPENSRSADGHREPTRPTLFCREPRTVTCSLDSRSEETSFQAESESSSRE